MLLRTCLLLPSGSTGSSMPPSSFGLALLVVRGRTVVEVFVDLLDRMSLRTLARLANGLLALAIIALFHGIQNDPQVDLLVAGLLVRASAAAAALLGS